MRLTRQKILVIAKITIKGIEILRALLTMKGVLKTKNVKKKKNKKIKKILTCKYKI